MKDRIIYFECGMSTKLTLKVQLEELLRQSFPWEDTVDE